MYIFIHNYYIPNSNANSEFLYKTHKHEHLIRRVCVRMCVYEIGEEGM